LMNPNPLSVNFLIVPSAICEFPEMIELLPPGLRLPDGHHPGV